MYTLCKFLSILFFILLTICTGCSLSTLIKDYDDDASLLLVLTTDYSD